MAITESQVSDNRKVMISLKKNAGPELIDNLQSSVTTLENLSVLCIDKHVLKIEYEFPQTCFADIWSRISKQLNSTHISFFVKLRLCLLGFAENNEKLHLLYPRHWYTYTEDIYIHYSDYREHDTDSKPKRLWRRYRENS